MSPYRKYLEDLELDCLPKGMQKRLPELATLEFIKNGQNLILTGNPRTGKTHTAIGLGLKACEQGYRVIYTTVPYLVTELKECNDAKKLRTYERRFEKHYIMGLRFVNIFKLIVLYFLVLLAGRQEEITL